MEKELKFDFYGTRTEKLAKSFFGVKRLPSVLVISPISAIFNTIIQELSVSKPKKAFYKYCEKEINGKKIGFLKNNPGVASIDAFLLAKKAKSKIIHIGYCMAAKKEKLGTIVFICSSSFGGRIFASNLSTKLLTCHTGKTVKNMLSKYRLEKKNEVVDMETALLYSIQPKSISIGIVSDTIKKPFFDLQKEDKKLIKKGTIRAAKLLPKIIKEIEVRE